VDSDCKQCALSIAPICALNVEWRAKWSQPAKFLAREVHMPIVVIDHKFNDFDALFSLLSAKTPPQI
jgi:hypothetical protein